MKLNPNSLDGICACLTYALGVEAPHEAAAPNADLKAYIDSIFNGGKADRVFMYNPDAIPQWVYEKYPNLTERTREKADIEIPLCAVLPSFTPVCYATMYSGAQPEAHGIQGYVKPVLTIDTLFDALIRAGKKPAIVAYENMSVGIIFGGRDMDCFVCRDVDEAISVGMELILKDEHDFIMLYNGNYDAQMHNYGPESIEALAELKVNDRLFSVIYDMISTHWKHHDTLLGFAMDHGSHKIDEANGYPRYDEKDIVGAHGFNLAEDLNIVHLYKGIPRSK